MAGEKVEISKYGMTEINHFHHDCRNFKMRYGIAEIANFYHGSRIFEITRW